MDVGRPKSLYLLSHLRAAAILLVMMYHYTTVYEENYKHIGYYPIQLPWGGYAVSVFFILSGFLAMYHFNEKDSLIQYGEKKFIRLYPAYWAGILITTFFMWRMMPQSLRPFKVILANFTMFQSYFLIDNVDGVYWTLGKDLMFYAIIGMVLFFKQRKNMVKICFVWINCLLIGYFLEKRIPSNYNLIVKIVHAFLISGYAQMFISGILIYCIFFEDSNKSKLLAIVTFPSCLCYQYLKLGGSYFFFFSAAILVTVLAVRYSIENKYINREKKWVGRLAIFFAKISYPLFLIHQNIGYAIIKLMEENGLVSEIFLCLPAAVSIAIAIVLHCWVEAPCIAYYKNRLRRKMKAE